MKTLKTLIVILLISFGANAQKAIQVKKIGQGKPLVFLPHIGCSSEMWDKIAQHYSKNYTCYLIDFAGFDKQAPITGTYTDQYLKALNEFLKENKLKDVTLVGQNYGAYVATKLALQNPKITKQIIAPDFYPNLAMILDTAMTAEKLAGIKNYIMSSMTTSDSATFAKGQKQMGHGMNFMDTTHIAKFVEWQVNSDRTTLAATLCEQLSDNLIPELQNNQVPILAMTTWYFAKTYKNMPISEAEAALNKMYKNTPNVSHAVTENAKDFIAMDQPEWFIEQMDTFLKRSN